MHVPIGLCIDSHIQTKIHISGTLASVWLLTKCMAWLKVSLKHKWDLNTWTAHSRSLGLNKEVGLWGWMPEWPVAAIQGEVEDWVPLLGLQCFMDHLPCMPWLHTDFFGILACAQAFSRSPGVSLPWVVVRSSPFLVPIVPLFKVYSCLRTIFSVAVTSPTISCSEPVRLGLGVQPQWELTRIQGGRSGSDRWKPRSRSEHAGSQKWYHFYQFT